MPEFGSLFSGQANNRNLTDEERVHVGNFLRLLKELIPDEEVEKEIEKHQK